MKKMFMVFALIFICAAVFAFEPAFDVNKVDVNHDGFVDDKEYKALYNDYGLSFDLMTGPSLQISYYEFYNKHLLFESCGDPGIWVEDKLFMHIVVKPRLDAYDYMLYIYDYVNNIGAVILARVH